MKFWKIFTNGLVNENPLLVLMIGLCSSLAVTTNVANGIGMGLSMTFVLMMSELFISLFRKLIPSSVRIPIFIIIIAAFTTIIDYVLQAYFPDLSASMGLFIPLIVVNCIIMGRVEAFASQQPIIDVIPDGLGMGLGYTWVLVAISLVREILGNGSILGYNVLGSGYTPILFFALPPGGFLVFGLFMSFGLFLRSRISSNTVDQNKAGCH
ncbi:electron transport complex subunit RsxE [Leadbettera azotonutricia]|uniref:Ion-translocating oxidoreductase complex subunit E n=1 Tax=Leadbettera azotonutricia (strain ATCC BAA-888 / DSM 13862 / ZAS-9) TaxID=545695 RepID=F5YEE9_LEAAZ|nr:electron transport complex subunit RsxE [Leadbettera azotonutricia]AEF81444.1 na(+)-translocating NADH-quinone reductase subunit d (na(+)-translocating nqr subunit d) (na(+)-nqr subunit d) (nqr complexsubunit d) (nqr-1 subunit d) [Leadbettera azotonutricia ZAS-9]